MVLEVSISMGERNALEIKFGVTAWGGSRFTEANVLEVTFLDLNIKANWVKVKFLRLSLGLLGSCGTEKGYWSKSYS